MHLKEIGMYRIIPGGICLPGETVSLKTEFVEENIFRMWTTLQDDFRQEETLVVERRVFDYPDVRVTEEEGFVTISTKELSAGMPWARSYELVYHDADKPETHGRCCVLRRVMCIKRTMKNTGFRKKSGVLLLSELEWSSGSKDVVI